MYKDSFLYVYKNSFLYTYIKERNITIKGQIPAKGGIKEEYDRGATGPDPVKIGGVSD